MDDLALIRLDPEEIDSIFPATTGRLALPGTEPKAVLSPPEAGWEGLGFRLAAVQTPAPVEGKQVGSEVELVDGVPYYVLEDAPPVSVPFSISPLQARKALRAVGLKASVDSYVATLSEEEQEEWEYCTEVRRDNTIIAAGAAALGWTGAQLDDLFILGSTL